MGLDPSGAALLRIGSNAVYRLATTPVVVRVAADSAVLDQMKPVVRVARWLEAKGLLCGEGPVGRRAIGDRWWTGSHVL
ncbi:hypothetical protein ACTWP5_13765 [Streptomyces sp. 4N509B]|uniref:hypothetical protein n=1 Tax=Streptomyces sp. 4N509B TaxID=3457413 RepID=UPI003FD05F5C